MLNYLSSNPSNSYLWVANYRKMSSQAWRFLFLWIKCLSGTSMPEMSFSKAFQMSLRKSSCSLLLGEEHTESQVNLNYLATLMWVSIWIFLWVNWNSHCRKLWKESLKKIELKNMGEKSSVDYTCPTTSRNWNVICWPFETSGHKKSMWVWGFVKKNSAYLM